MTKQAPSPERRSDQRQVVRIDATAREFGRAPIKVIVTDLSEHGCRLSGYGLKEGATIWVEFASMSPLEAHVIWAGDEWVGCRFEKPLGLIRLMLAEMSEPTVHQYN
jgi:hypothetical protein